MRVLLDENLPRDLAAHLKGHDAETVSGRGWSGVENGDLLKLASADHQAFLTMDRRLPVEHPVDELPFAVVVIEAPTNRMAHLRPLVPRILEALDTAAPGTLSVVAA